MKLCDQMVGKVDEKLAGKREHPEKISQHSLVHYNFNSSRTVKMTAGMVMKYTLCMFTFFV
jgi:hypothetical protein